MEILEQSSTKLVLQGKPINVWIGGVIALVIWLVSLYCLLTFPFNSTLWKMVIAILVFAFSFILSPRNLHIRSRSESIHINQKRNFG